MYKLQELVALVPRKASPAAALQPAWHGVCRLPEFEQPQEPHQRAIDEVSNSFAALRSPLHMLSMRAALRKAETSPCMEQHSPVWKRHPSTLNMVNEQSRQIEAHVWEHCLDNLACCAQGRGQARDELCWQLHPEQLQLAPAAAGLVSALTEVPIEADRQSLRLADPPGLITPQSPLPPLAFTHFLSIYGAQLLC